MDASVWFAVITDGRSPRVVPAVHYCGFCTAAAWFKTPATLPGSSYPVCLAEQRAAVPLPASRVTWFVTWQLHYAAWFWFGSGSHRLPLPFLLPPPVTATQPAPERLLFIRTNRLPWTAVLFVVVPDCVWFTPYRFRLPAAVVLTGSAPAPYYLVVPALLPATSIWFRLLDSLPWFAFRAVRSHHLLRVSCSHSRYGTAHYHLRFCRHVPPHAFTRFLRSCLNTLVFLLPVYRVGSRMPFCLPALAFLTDCGSAFVVFWIPPL